MYVNRISFSITKSECSPEQLKEFNKVGKYLEELIFHYLQGNVNCGGFGFYHNIIQSGNPGTELKTYGQIIDFMHKVKESEIIDFFKLNLSEQINYLLDKLEKSIKEIDQRLSKIELSLKNDFINTTTL